MEDLTEAYLSIYENHDDLNEVKGFGGHVDPNTGKSSGLRSPAQQAHATHWRNRQQGIDVPDPRRSKFYSGGSKGSTTGYHQGEPPEDFAKGQDPDLAMTPAKRMETRATALRSRGQGKRANKIDAVRNRPPMQEDHVDEGRAFAGGPDHTHSFPLSPEEQELARKIGRGAQEKAQRQASESPTKSPARKKKKLEFEVRENVYDLVLTHLLDEGYCDSQDSAIKMMAAMSQDWINQIITEAPFQISGPHPTTVDGTKLDYSPSNVGKPYQNRKRAQTKADKLNDDHGASVYRVTKVD